MRNFPPCALRKSAWARELRARKGFGQLWEEVHEVAERILSICGEPMCFERILQKIFKEYGLSMNFEQYVLVGSTVRSYFSWLKDTGKMKAEFQDSMLLWQRV